MQLCCVHIVKKKVENSMFRLLKQTSKKRKGMWRNVWSRCVPTAVRCATERDLDAPWLGKLRFRSFPFDSSVCWIEHLTGSYSPKCSMLPSCLQYGMVLGLQSFIHHPPILYHPPIHFSVHPSNLLNSMCLFIISLLIHSLVFVSAFWDFYPFIS